MPGMGPLSPYLIQREAMHNYDKECRYLESTFIIYVILNKSLPISNVCSEMRMLIMPAAWNDTGIESDEVCQAVSPVSSEFPKPVNI